MFPIQTDARIQILAGVSLLHSSRPVGGQEGLAGYGRRYTGTKPETVDTRQADALRSRPVLSYSETGRSLVRIQSPRPIFTNPLDVRTHKSNIAARNSRVPGGPVRSAVIGPLSG